MSAISIQRLGAALIIVVAMHSGAWAQEHSPPVVPPTFDPSKNVLDLVLAAVKRLDDVMGASVKRQDDLRDAEIKYQNAMREAETRRVNELAAQKQGFDLELARGIRANQDANALLLATSVRELKTDTSDRIAKLEQFANEQRGRSSATDPAYTKLLEDVRALSTSRADIAGVGSGRSDMIGWLFGGLAALGAVIAVLAFARRHPAPSPVDPVMAEILRELVKSRSSA